MIFAGYIALFIISLALLLKASDVFVDGAKEIGVAMGISPFVIGVTIVALGTSLPELATSVSAVMADTSDVVVGNVVGSNIANILLVLGLTAIVAGKIKMDFDIMDTDMPLLFISSILLYFVLSDGVFSFFEAIVFLIGFVVFLLNSFSGKKDTEDIPEKARKIAWIYLIGGGLVVWLSAGYTIMAIKEISVLAGVPTKVIAVSMVALGTSLPEVIVSIMAARKGHSGIAVGNVLGSNIFNTYTVMAIPSFFGHLDIPSDFISFHIPYMIAMTVVFAFISLSRSISKWEGVMLLVFYLYYLYQIINYTP